MVYSYKLPAVALPLSEVPFPTVTTTKSPTANPPAKAVAEINSGTESANSLFIKALLS